MSSCFLQESQIFSPGKIEGTSFSNNPKLILLPNEVVRYVEGGCSIDFATEVETEPYLIEEVFLLRDS